MKGADISCPSALVWVTVGAQNFKALADALEWVLHQQGIPFWEHYLDDFIILRNPRFQACQQGSGDSGQGVQQTGHTHGGPQEGRPNNMPHISGH